MNDVKRWVLIILAAGFLIGGSVSGLLAGSTGTISGYVRDASTKKPLPGANVLIKGTQLGAATDLEGHYFIPRVPPGEYVLVARYVGYTPLEAKVKVVANQKVECNFELHFAVVKGKEVVVTAQAEGQIAAINQQLTSRSIKNVVSSARIQELPDANAAESVGRLPGVSILRSGGEGTKVVIRGLSPKYNAITVNGVRVPATGRGDRSTDISMISPYMLQGIEVIKAITPDQEADVLGGTVNFRFRKAKKRKGLHLDGLLQGGYNGLENKYGDYKFIMASSNRFWKDRLGIFAQTDVERRNRSADQLNVGYDILNPSLDRWDKVIAQSASFQKAHRIRSRYGASLVLDSQLPHGSLVLSNFWNKTVTDLTRRGETFNAGSNTHSYTLSEGESQLMLLTNVLHFEYALGRHHLDATVANSRSENNAPQSLSYTFLERSAFLNVSGFENPFTLVDSAKNNVDNTYLNSISASRRNTRENQFTAGTNLELNLPVIGSVASKIKMGVKYRHQYRKNDEDQWQRKFEAYQYLRDSVLTHFTWMKNADIGSAVRDRLPYSLFADPNPDKRPFLNGKFAFGPTPRVDLLHALYDMLRTTPDNVRIGLGGTPLLWRNWPSSIRPDYHGTEDYFGAYIMSQIDFGKRWMLLPGVRYERNRTTYTANRGDDSRRAEEGYNYEPTTKTRENEYWLPMVHAKFRPSSWLTLHFAYTNTLTRPSYGRIVPSWFLNTTSNQLSYNNYRLKPGRSRNYDLFAAVYHNYVGFFSLGVFQKTIRDLIYNPGPMVVLDPAVWHLPPDLGAEVIVTSVNNKYQAKLWGLEMEWQTYFWYLPRPLNGIVLNVNYTHIRSETKYPLNRLRQVVVGYDTTFVFGQKRIMPVWQTVNVDTFYTGRIVHQPNHIFNISMGYDYKGFSARVSMLYTDDILTSTNFWEELRASTDKHVRWDLSVKQKLPVKGLMLYLNLNNINNAVDRSLIAGSSYPSREEYYDFTGDLGLRYRF